MQKAVLEAKEAEEKQLKITAEEKRVGEEAEASELKQKIDEDVRLMVDQAQNAAKEVEQKNLALEDAVQEAEKKKKIQETTEKYLSIIKDVMAKKVEQ